MTSRRQTCVKSTVAGNAMKNGINVNVSEKLMWISVEEQLPPLLQKVLFSWICPGTNRNISMGYLCKDGWDIYLPYDSFKMSNAYFTVTHWMELPDYPKEKL